MKNIVLDVNTIEQYNYHSNLKIKLHQKDNKKYKPDYKTDYILNYLNSNSFNENAFYIQSTIDQRLQKIAEKSLIDNLALFERKYRDWSGSFKKIEEILKIENEYWKIAKVVSKKSKNIQLLVIDSEEIITLDVDINSYGPKKVSPINYLDLNMQLYLIFELLGF